MSKFELSISPNYVKDWGLVEGIRELFQNAIDQETVDSTNKMFFSYNEDTEELTVGNRYSTLEPETLLLGTTTKADDEDTIGQFGEGYKIATLVLLRTGHDVIFYNYGRREIWKPRLVKSRRYHSKILTFFTEHKVFTKVPDNNLTIVVSNITRDDYESIISSNLHLMDDDEIGETISTSHGSALLNPAFAGQIYVNGLYVCMYNELVYGYDINAKYIRLDRSRSLADSFDIEWESGMIWKLSKDPRIMKLIEDNATDVCRLASTGNEVDITIRDDMADKFKEEYGDNAVPVSSTQEYNEVDNLYTNARPVPVSSSHKSVIMSSSVYDDSDLERSHSTESIFQRLTSLRDRIIYDISETDATTLDAILRDMEEDE